MASREVLKEWVVEALSALGGQGSVLDVSKHVWRYHEQELRDAGDLLYTWQYDIRWAGQQLRDAAVLRAVHGDKALPWELANKARR